MAHIYSRFSTEEKNHFCQWRYEKKGRYFFENGWLVCRMEFNWSSGIKEQQRAARPYQSSFTVTVRHLSVSKAQLAAQLCHVGQNSIGKIFECDAFPSDLFDESHSELVVRGIVIKALSCQYDPKGWLTRTVSIQKGLFLIPNAVWDIFRLNISSGMFFNRNQMHC